VSRYGGTRGGSWDEIPGALVCPHGWEREGWGLGRELMRNRYTTLHYIAELHSYSFLLIVNLPLAPLVLATQRAAVTSQSSDVRVWVFCLIAALRFSFFFLVLLLFSGPFCLGVCRAMRWWGGGRENGRR
jgi:hypothetical protein